MENIDPDIATSLTQQNHLKRAKMNKDGPIQDKMEFS